jgi:hypothetical protein
MAFDTPGLDALLEPDPVLLHGRYQDVLTDVTEVGAVIADPPYGSRTHRGHARAVDRDPGGGQRRELSYEHWTERDVRECVSFWAPRVPRGWMAFMSCSDLSPVWRQVMEDAGRYTFAPVPCIIRGMTCRMAGDGPSSWAVYLNVSRPRCKSFLGGWTRPGAYVVGRGGRRHIGGKPLDLMLKIVRDYTLPGWLVADPCAGFATTGIAARGLGRDFVGAEVDADAFNAGTAALAAAPDPAACVARLAELDELDANMLKTKKARRVTK